ncbi:MAG: hypothetical protein JWR19_779 [Pedosphaera sp.]|nr:hypothetical protein [Pedosphaera sp.]
MIPKNIFVVRASVRMILQTLHSAGKGEPLHAIRLQSWPLLECMFIA